MVGVATYGSCGRLVLLNPSITATGDGVKSKRDENSDWAELVWPTGLFITEQVEEAAERVQDSKQRQS
jgi:hypothetical protein